MTGADLEARIYEELRLCEKARDEGRRQAAHVHWEQFVRLIAQRRPEKVRQMEREKELT